MTRLHQYVEVFSDEYIYEIMKHRAEFNFFKFSVVSWSVGFNHSHLIHYFSAFSVSNQMHFNLEVIKISFLLHINFNFCYHRIMQETL